MLTYCKRCVMPDSRPNNPLNEDGICAACVAAAEKKSDIDWEARRAELEELFSRFRTKDASTWDCIVPVSGGKDSTYQTHLLRKVYNMRPLAVTFRTDARTPLGEHNIQALREIGVDHLDVTPNPVGFNKFRRKAFFEVGDMSLPDHLASWAIVPQIALRFNIPLVVWGENPDMEYGGAADLRKVSKLNRVWFRHQHILKGRGVEDWTDAELPLEELKFCIYPDEQELDALGYTPIFLGYYEQWDAKRNAEVAEQYGFKARTGRPIMGLYDFADLDCEHIVLHHYIKWLKFGFNRVTDNACNEIRKGRLTREEAIKLVQEKDGIKPPKEYIHRFCKRIGITTDEFWEVCERFRNHDVWKKDANGEWYIEGWIGGDKLPDRFPHEELSESDRNP